MRGHDRWVLGALALSLGLAAFGARPVRQGASSWIGQEAPELKGGTGWINSEPLTLEKLRGKVVLIDFWEYTCVNCLRTLPYLKGWYERYADDGLVIIGVHTPEFQFSGEDVNVQEGVEALGIKYPVVLDSRYRIWFTYQNRWWPRKFLIDKDGRIRYDHIGEGGYRETEAMIQQLLKEVNPEVRFAESIDYVRPEDRPGAVCYPRSPETYAGWERGTYAHPVERDRAGEYNGGGLHQDGHLVLSGRWRVETERLRHARRTEEFEDFVALPFHATEVNAVFHTSDGPYEILLTLDGEPVPKAMWGEDVRSDSEGRTLITVDKGRMYRLIGGTRYGHFMLRLYTSSDDLALYAFTFGSCIVPPEEQVGE